jgi:hypothetical protein
VNGEGCWVIGVWGFLMGDGGVGMGEVVCIMFGGGFVEFDEVRFVETTSAPIPYYVLGDTCKPDSFRYATTIIK